MEVRMKEEGKKDVLVSIWIVIFTISLDAYFELICLWFTVSWRNSQGPSIILDKSTVREDTLPEQTQPNMHLTHSESKRRVLASFIFNEAFEDPHRLIRCKESLCKLLIVAYTSLPCDKVIERSPSFRLDHYAIFILFDFTRGTLDGHFVG